MLLFVYLELFNLTLCQQEERKPILKMKAKEDPRISRSKMAIFQAFTKLSQEKSFERITVSELCKKAGLARITFYKHFETKEQLIDALCEELFAHALEPLEVDKHLGLQEIASHLLWHLKENTYNLQSLFKNEQGQLFALRFSRHFIHYCKTHKTEFFGQKPQGLTPSAPSAPAALSAPAAPSPAPGSSFLDNEAFLEELAAAQFMACLLYWKKDKFAAHPDDVAKSFIYLMNFLANEQ